MRAPVTNGEQLSQPAPAVDESEQVFGIPEGFGSRIKGGLEVAEVVIELHEARHRVLDWPWKALHQALKLSESPTRGLRLTAILQRL